MLLPGSIRWVTFSQLANEIRGQERVRSTRFPFISLLERKLRERTTMLRIVATTTLRSFSRRALRISQIAPSRNMNTEKNNTVKSPPHSPPAKRVKTDGTTSNSSTMAHVNGSTVPVTTMDQAPPLLIKKLSEKARLPTRGSAFAAGYDIYAAKATVIPARGKALVDTDISMAVPAGTCKSCTVHTKECKIQSNLLPNRRAHRTSLRPRLQVSSSPLFGNHATDNRTQELH